MNILITGSTGYLGSKLIERLRENHVVYALTHKKNVEIDGVHKIDLNDLSEKWVQDNEINTVIHTSGRYERKNVMPHEIIESNIYSPTKILDTCAKAGVKTWINTSTALDPYTNIYSLSKEHFSEYGKLYTTKYEICFVNLKLELFYGPEQPIDNFIPCVIDRLSKNKTINLNSGTQKRDIIHIDDVVNIYDLILNKTFEKKYIEYIIGTGDKPSIEEIVLYLKDKMNSESKITFKNQEYKKTTTCGTHITAEYTISNPWKKGLSTMISNFSDNKK